MHLWDNFESPRCSFGPNRCTLASFGCFLMMAMAHIRVFACARCQRSSGERDCKSVRDASLHDENVRDTLAYCGLLKFMRIPLMRSLCLLMQTLIGFWDVDEEVFLFQG